MSVFTRQADDKPRLSVFFRYADVKRGFDRIAPIYEEVTLLGGIFAGSFPAWCAFDDQHEFPPEPHDIDVFPTNEDSYNALRKFFTDHPSMYPQRESEWAITFYYEPLPIQLIKPAGEVDAEKLLMSFDLRVAKAALASPTQLIIGAGFFTSMADRTLQIQRINHPFGSMMRVVKYARKGFDIAPGELLKIFDAWDEMTPELKKSARDTIQNNANLESNQDEMFWDEPEEYWEY